MSYTAKGVIESIGHTVQVSDKFRKREVTVRLPAPDTEYGKEQYLKFELVQDKCDLADQLNLGEAVTVHFDIEGRKWKDTVFNTLKAWKIEAEPF
jgi:single-strand DNA-binding protein